LSADTDLRLRRLFRAAHADVPAPRFERVLARRPPRRQLRRWLPLAAAALLAILVAVPLERANRERRALAFAREIADWRAPTDRLLEPLRPLEPLRGFGEPSILESM